MGDSNVFGRVPARHPCCGANEPCCGRLQCRINAHVTCRGAPEHVRAVHAETPGSAGAAAAALRLLNQDAGAAGLQTAAPASGLMYSTALSAVLQRPQPLACLTAAAAEVADLSLLEAAGAPSGTQLHAARPRTDGSGDAEGMRTAKGAPRDAAGDIAVELAACADESERFAGPDFAPAWGHTCAPLAAWLAVSQTAADTCMYPAHVPCTHVRRAEDPAWEGGRAAASSEKRKA